MLTVLNPIKLAVIFSSPAVFFNKGSVRSGDGKAEHLPICTVCHHIGPGKRLAGIVYYNAGERFLSEPPNRR